MIKRDAYNLNFTLDWTNLPTNLMFLGALMNKVCLLLLDCVWFSPHVDCWAWSLASTVFLPWISASLKASYSSVLFLFYVELETKRILLDIFKEKQQKSVEAGTIPSFYKKACDKFFFLGDWLWSLYISTTRGVKWVVLCIFGNFDLWLCLLYEFIVKYLCSIGSEAWRRIN